MGDAGCEKTTESPRSRAAAQISRDSSTDTCPVNTASSNERATSNTAWASAVSRPCSATMSPGALSIRDPGMIRRITAEIPFFC